MIVEEYVCTRSDGKDIYRRYSDDSQYVIQQETGAKFAIAEDLSPCPYTYVEGDQFEWYISEIIDNTYTDTVIEKAIPGKEDTAILSNQSITETATTEEGVLATSLVR